MAEWGVRGPSKATGTSRYQTLCWRLHKTVLKTCVFNDNFWSRLSKSLYDRLWYLFEYLIELIKPLILCSHVYYGNVMSVCPCDFPSVPYLFITLRPRQDGCHFPNIFKRIFLNENVWILTKISLKFVARGPVYNIPALVLIMAWRRPGDKPLSEPMMVLSTDAYMGHLASMSYTRMPE